MRKLLQGVHIIANCSAINDSIQKQNAAFNASHAGILFIKYQKKRSNIRAVRVISYFNYVILFILHLVCVIIQFS